MAYPYDISTEQDENTTGLGLDGRMAARAATARPNEAGTAAAEPVEASEGAPSPRLVIRGENHSSGPNPAAAFVDWLNFTFPFQLSGVDGFMALDGALRQAFGFGLEADRGKGHLNYERSWELGNNYGIFATGGDSVGGTSFFSLSGEGCAVVREWLRVYDFLSGRNAKITRVDLAHDDYQGRITLDSARSWFDAGDFHAGKGHPPKGRFIDDFGSGTGKTLYVGNRKNGKTLRIYEKGKQLGDPNSPWVRWELELHNNDRDIPLLVLMNPARYLAAAYPPCAWISERQCRIETATRRLDIGLDVLTDSARKSYGKLFWFYWKVLEMPPHEIVKMLAVEGIPSRLNHAVPGEV